MLFFKKLLGRAGMKNPTEGVELLNSGVENSHNATDNTTSLADLDRKNTSALFQYCYEQLTTFTPLKHKPKFNEALVDALITNETIGNHKKMLQRGVTNNQIKSDIMATLEPLLRSAKLSTNRMSTASPIFEHIEERQYYENMNKVITAVLSINKASSQPHADEQTFTANESNEDPEIGYYQQLP